MIRMAVRKETTAVTEIHAADRRVIAASGAG
jgi:hypothetical protein